MVLEWQESERVLIWATLNKLTASERCEPCGKKFCLIYDSVGTAATVTTEVCYRTFQIQNGLLNCDYEQVLYLAKFKVCDESLYYSESKGQVSL